MEETSSRVDELKVRNQVLEARIDEKQKDLKNLKELFLLQAEAKSEKLKGIDLMKLLSDDYDDPDGASSTSKKK